MTETLRLGTASVTIGPWTVGPIARTDERPPHRHSWEHRPQLDVIWADREGTVPVAVNDYDGCYAVVLAGLDVDTLAAAMNTAQIEPAEVKLGRDLREPARRVLAALGRAR